MRNNTRKVDRAGVTASRTRPTAWRRLVSDQAGQDLLEYGILLATVGIAGVLIFPIIQGKLSAAYSANDSAIQRDWEPCDPGGCP
jgi:Flp pilus assembly pilin Flp